MARPTNNRRADRLSRHVEAAAKILSRLTPSTCALLARRAEIDTEPDGYPTRSPGFGHGRGSGPTIRVETESGSADTVALTSAEAAVFARSEARHDPVGDAVKRTEDHLKEVLRILRRVERDVHFVVNAADDHRDRRSPPGGTCLVEGCGAGVSGVGTDRMRRGLCPKCYFAFAKFKLEHPELADDPGAVRRAFEVVRNQYLQAQAEEDAA